MSDAPKPTLDADGVDAALRSIRELSTIRDVLQQAATVGGFSRPLKSSEMHVISDCNRILDDTDDLGLQISQIDLIAGQVFRLFFVHGKKYDAIGRLLYISRRTAIRYSVKAKEILTEDAELNAVLASLSRRATKIKFKRG